MPTIPTGGLSIFVNLAIFVIGGFLNSIRKFGISVPLGGKIYNYFVSKDYDTTFRRAMGYSLVTILFSLMSVTTSVSIYNRMIDKSNFDFIKTGAEKIIIIYKDMFEDKKTEDKLTEPPVKFDIKLLSQK